MRSQNSSNQNISMLSENQFCTKWLVWVHRRLGNVRPSRGHRFHLRLHHIHQNAQIYSFCNTFLFVKEMRWHDITLTGHNTYHENVSQKFRSWDNGDIFRVVSEPTAIPSITKKLIRTTVFFFMEHKTCCSVQRALSWQLRKTSVALYSCIICKLD